MSDLFLIWSEEHGAWWGPGWTGYTTSIKAAGRYSREAAEKIVQHANYAPGIFHEIAIPDPM